MKFIRLLAPFCLLALLGYAAFRPAAAQPGGFTLEQVLSAPFPSELVAAPTGERIAWFFDAEGKRNVWAAEGPEFKARQLTRYDEDSGQELTELTFTHDGRWLVYVRGGNANQAGDVPNHQRPGGRDAGRLRRFVG